MKRAPLPKAAKALVVVQQHDYVAAMAASPGRQIAELRRAVLRLVVGLWWAISMAQQKVRATRFLFCLLLFTQFTSISASGENHETKVIPKMNLPPERV